MSYWVKIFDGKTWRIETLAPRVRKTIAYINTNRSREQQVADAALIATAPQLLDEVKEFRRAVQYYRLKQEVDDPSDDEGLRLKDIKIAMLDALIADSEGRSS
jgi:hypothetical protein